MSVGKMVSELRRMTVTELRRKYAEVFGEPTRWRHKDSLVRRIAWRVQANAEGGLPERARRRAQGIPCPLITGMRNVPAHECGDIILVKVYEVVTGHVPELIARLETLIEALEKDVGSDAADEQ